MSTSESTVANDSQRSPFGCSRHGGCGRGNWSPANIFAMVLGFVLFWPVGLVILFWIFKGRNVKDLPAAVKKQWNRMFSSDSAHPESDNVVFNEYQQTQFDRIKELKEEIKARAKRFRNFRFDAKRRADEAEFKEFMSNNPSQDEKDDK